MFIDLTIKADNFTKKYWFLNCNCKKKKTSRSSNLLSIFLNTTMESIALLSNRAFIATQPDAWT